MTLPEEGGHAFVPALFFYPPVLLSPIFSDHPLPTSAILGLNFADF